MCKYTLSVLDVSRVIIIKQKLMEKRSEDVKDCRVVFSWTKIAIMWKKLRM